MKNVVPSSFGWKLTFSRPVFIKRTCCPRLSFSLLSWGQSFLIFFPFCQGSHWLISCIMLLLAENQSKCVVCIQLHIQLHGGEKGIFLGKKIVISKIKMQFSVFVCGSVTLAVLASFSLSRSYWSLCCNYYSRLEFKINMFVYKSKYDSSLEMIYVQEKRIHTWRLIGYIFFSFLCCLGAVLLSSVQGLAINVDPVLYSWIIYQPQKRASRHIQQVCIFRGEQVGRGEAFSSI